MAFKSKGMLESAGDEPSSADVLTARRRLCLALPAALLGGMAPAVARADPLLTYPLRIRKHTLRVEVADTDQSRRTGLMGRRSLADDMGMLFVYERPSVQAMWMKNTLIPLSVAFVGADARILNIEDMQPLTENAHASDGPAAWSIETNAGWFEKRGIRAGDRVEGLAAIARRR